MPYNIVAVYFKRIISINGLFARFSNYLKSRYRNYFAVSSTRMLPYKLVLFIENAAMVSHMSYFCAIF